MVKKWVVGLTRVLVTRKSGMETPVLWGRTCEVGYTKTQMCLVFPQLGRYASLRGRGYWAILNV